MEEENDQCVGLCERGEVLGSVEVSTGGKTEMELTQNGGREPSSDKEGELAMPPLTDSAPVTNLEVSLERLLQRQRSEIMFELRRLQYGERPVTGQEQRRRTVENLVLRAVGPTPRSSIRTPAAQLPDDVTNRLSETQSGDVSRPEHIVVEVNALVESRPVSSILRSLQFRRRLENSVRGALETMRGQGYAPQTSMVSSGINNNSRMSSNRETEQLRSASDVERSPSGSLSLRSESPQPPQPSSVAEAAPVSFLQPSVPAQAPDASFATNRAAEWIRQHTAPSADAQHGAAQRRPIDYSLLNRMHQEEFIYEISDLIHRQLVTSALNGSFRDVLERRMRRQMEESGIDGTRVQEQLQQLPRTSGHLRNDFFDLGILPGPDAGGAVGDGGDVMDNVSVISATAAVALPHAYTQSNAAMSREIQSLRSELQELKSMMKLSFDLQLDIQRSIKQEISAALAQTLGGATTPAPLSSLPYSQSRAAVSGGRCLICLDQQVDTVLYQCGHLCLCHACAMQLRQNGSNCPVCRAPIRDIMRTYRP